MTPVGDNFQGAQAAINLWKPLVEQPQEFSTSQIWISSADGEEAIEAGWEVYKNLYGDDEPKFFLYWTADRFHSTGCYNALCSGFVQTTLKISLGSRVDNISIFNGQQQEASFTMFKWTLPAEGGFGISSYFRDVKVLDRNYEAKVVETVLTTTTNADCYGLKIDGTFFYCGGPGVSGICQGWICFLAWKARS
ncbi:hypothetical protein MKW98_021312 [Papaver atlanticum]|uniref:Neprosin PEP catalytic domain-containing protein n=1 Tax=Papaver atlanticum TaxID=357466 RepID=A0AAD4SRF9_9MAGN|nr:hypothetical protein MKW98_021312 [Papaver atlanticum]